MRYGKLNREEAIKKAGIAKVEEVEAMNCEITNRVQTDGDEAIEFSASVNFTDAEGWNRALTVYYYQDQEDRDRVDGDWGALDWEIEGYEIW